ncbi:hypothetical protein [Cyclobacterium marinum]|uniref:hypothetical protein n=1 Tax=Cyclobacterium marinum TaxID=104 RepID=UPI0030DC7C45|tara:strand:+ start:107589 stop:109160 length:1572 start_codon:yes stop_codon:yes gene_type:complete
MNIKLYLTILFIFISFLTNAQNYTFEILGPIVTEKEYKIFDHKFKYVRGYKQKRLDKLVKKGNIDFLKKVASFKYQDFFFGNKKMYKINKEDSFPWFMAASNLGDFESKYNIGLFYLFGHGVTKDYKAAFTAFKELTEKGYDPAREMLGYCYYEGYGVEKDIDLGSYHILSLRDSLIQPLAKVALGKIYLEGNNIKKDTLKAVEKFHEKIRFHISQDILLSLLYSKSRVSVKKKLIELAGNSSSALSYIYSKSIERNSSKMSSEVFYDYSNIILRSPFINRTWEQTQKAIDTYLIYKDTVSHSINEDDWFYGYNLYHINYLRGDPNLATTGVQVMETAATNDNQFARELSNIYRNSAYQHIRDSKKASFWELKAELYENSNSDIATILALATGNNREKDVTKAYQLAKIGFERTSVYDKDYNAFYYLYYSLCKISNMANSEDCLKLEKAYAEYIYAWSCNKEGKTTCTTCNGSGNTPTYRSNTRQCTTCNGFGYLKCKPYLNLPKDYITELVPSDYKNISHLP